MSLFATATKVVKPSTAIKEKMIVPVHLGNKITELQKRREEIKNAEAALEPLEADIKAAGLEEFLKIYKQTKRKPDSFSLESEGSKILFIVQDRYLKVTPEKEDAITMFDKKFAEENIERVNTFKFNSDLLAKYEKQISDAIMKIKGMSDDDKLNLIQKEEVVTIKKGTIEKLAEFKNPDMILQLIQPVVNIKG